MNRKETIKRLKNWISETEKVRNYHMKFDCIVKYDSTNDVEYLAVETDSQSVLYGLIRLLESYSGLQFYGVSLNNGKIQVLLSLSQLV